MQTLWQDLRYGLRGLWKNPGFTTVAVVSLALGIGANTAIFSLVHQVLLKSPPFRDPDRLVMVWEDASAIGFPQDNAAPANYADWKAQNQVFEDMAALDWRNFNLTGDGEPEKISAYAVTANFFPLIGAQPALGRSFSAGEEGEGAGKVAILSYGLWQRRYGADPNLVGKEILLDDEKYTVIGVMPAGFQFMQGYIGLWVPKAFSQQELANRGNHYLTVVARLKPGVTAVQAQADIAAITERIARNYPNDAEGLKAAVVPMHEQLAGESRRPLTLLLVAVGFVLLIACANIANLLLARAANRHREIAIRSALGASRGRIVGQLLSESLLLAVIGGGGGLLIASYSFAFLRKLIPPGLRLTTDLTLDWPVLGFALAVSLATGLVFGLLPALQASKVDLNETLKQGGGRGGLSAGGNRLRGALVIAEVALSLVLLVGAGLLIQTLYNLQSQYSLFRPESLLTMRTTLPDRKYKEQPKRAAFYDQVLERVKALPGVVSAGYTTSVPLQWKGGASGFEIEGRPNPSIPANAIHRQISAEYLQTVGITLRQGRYFDQRDDRQSTPVALVNETLARQYWPGESALGKRVRLADIRPWVAIVGVVADVRQMGMDAPVKSEIYFPYRQIDSHIFFKPRDLVIRASGNPADLVAAARREIHAVDPDQPVSNIATMAEQLSEETAQRRISMILLTTFAALALLLALVGIYGVLAYFVVQHTPEIGLRLALGAQRRDVLRLVLGKGMMLAGTGVGLGLLTAVALTRLMRSLLYGVSASDPLTFALLSMLLLLIASLACYLPARRATKVDPMIALRYE